MVQNLDWRCGLLLAPHAPPTAGAESLVVFCRSFGPGKQNDNCWYSSHRATGLRCSKLFGTVYKQTSVGNRPAEPKIIAAAKDGRGGLGTIVVMSAGNTGNRGILSNAFGSKNLRHSMSIGAHGESPKS